MNNAIINNTRTSTRINDRVAYYDTATSRVCVTGSDGCGKGSFDDRLVINKVSDLREFDRIEFCNRRDFSERHPEANLDKYYLGEHSAKAAENMGRNIAAYIHLSRCYKSLAVLADHGFTRFIDGFIESCIAEHTDHPATIGYTAKQVHKILRLRKTVFDLFEPYLKDYDTYCYVFMLQNHYNYSDSELRKVRKEFKKSKEIRFVYPEVKERYKNGLKLLG